MADPIETLYVEIAVKADQLIADVEKAVDAAEKKLKRMEDQSKKNELEFLKLGNVFKTVFAVQIVQSFLNVLKQIPTTIINITKQAVSLAATYEGVEMTFKRLLGSEEKSAEFMEVIRKSAAATGQGMVQMALGAKQFLPYAEGSSDAFQKMIEAQMGLAAADPMQGMMGAAFALREFLSGTYLSLAQRFELPKAKLRDILKNHKDIEGRMQALNQLLEQFGMGFAMVSEQAGTLPGMLGQVKGVWEEALLALGQPVLEELKEHMADLLTFVKDNKEEIIELATKFGEWIAESIDGIRKVIDSFESLWKALDSIGTELAGPEWIDTWIMGLKRLGAIIDVSILDSLNAVAQTIAFIGDNIQALAKGEKLKSIGDYLEERRGARKESWASALERWGLAKRAPETVATRAPIGVTPEREAPAGLDEKSEKAALKGAQKIKEILKNFQKGVEKLRRNHAKKLASIDEREQRDREKAILKHEKSVDKLTEDHRKKQVRDQQDFAREWKRLIRDQHQEVLDAEWEFRYQEEKLIAEGDTLALRDLRIRYAHEKEVRGREQQDAQQDEKSDQEIRQAEREQDFRDRMLELQGQLTEQLNTITDNATRAREKERETYGERLQDLEDTKNERLTKVGEFLAQEVEKNSVAADEIKALWGEAYGTAVVDAVNVGMAAMQELRAELGLVKQDAIEAAAALSQAMARGEARAHRRSYGWGGQSYTGPARDIGTSGTRGEARSRRFAQHGLNEIISRPTSLIVGEGGRPEHVRVTPLSGMGGGMGGRLSINFENPLRIESGGALSPGAESTLIEVFSEALQQGIARSSD